MFLTSLDVSYGSALLPAPARRYVTATGASPNLNPGGGTPVYLWFTQQQATGDAAAAAIADVVVLYDDEPAPAGYTRVARDLSGGASRVHLAYAVVGAAAAAAGAPRRAATAVQVLAGDEPPPPPPPSTPAATVEVVPRPLSLPGAPAVLRLAVTYAPLVGDVGAVVGGGDGEADTAADAAAWRAALAVGDALDVCDRLKRWRPARVVGVASPDDGSSGDSLTVALTGWSDRHTEALPRGSDRIAPPGRHRQQPPLEALLAKASASTRGGSASTSKRVPQGDPLTLDEGALAALEAKVDDLLAGAFPADPCEREYFSRLELPSAVTEVLSALHPTEAARERSASFLGRALEVVAWHLRQVDAPLPREVRTALGHLFLEDASVCYFYDRYGSATSASAIAAAVDGWAARLPAGGASRYFVQTVNRFYAAGGHDALLARLRHQAAAARAYNAAVDTAGAPTATAAEGASPVAPGLATPTAAGTAGAAGGPVPLPPALETPPGDDPLAEAATLSAVLQVPRVCYTEAWAAGYYQPLRDALLDRLLTLPAAQLKRANRDHLDGVRDRLVRLGNTLVDRIPAHAPAILAGPHGACVGDANVGTAVERWGMALAARLLRADSLALRVKAVADVCAVAEEVMDAEDTAARYPALYGAQQQAQVQQQHLLPAGGGAAVPVVVAGGGGRQAGYATTSAGAPKTWYDAPRLARYLHDHRVLEAVLGMPGNDEGIGGGGNADEAGGGGGAGAGSSARSSPLASSLVHVQTLSRVGPLLKFMASHVMLVEPQGDAAAPAAAAQPGTGAEGETGATPDALSPGPPPLLQHCLTVRHIDALLGLAMGDEESAAATTDSAAAAAAAAGAPGSAGSASTAAATGGPARDDELTHAVFDLVGTLVRVRGLPMFLLRRMSDVLERRVPLARFDVPTVALLREVTDAGIDAVEDARTKARIAHRASTIIAGGRAIDVYAIDESDDDDDESDEEQPTAASGASDGSFASDGDVWFLLPQLLQYALAGSRKAPAATAGNGAPPPPPLPPPTAAEAETMAAASDAVIELLRGRGQHAVDVVKACCEELRAGRSVPQAIGLVSAILQEMERRNALDTASYATHAASSSAAAAPSGVTDPHLRAVLRYLHSDAFNAVAVLAEETERYKAVAAARLAAAPPDTPPTALTIDGRAHVDNVTLRLTFLGTLLRTRAAAAADAGHPPPSLLPDVTRLWVALVDGGLCDEEAEAFFKWLNTLRAKGSGAGGLHGSGVPLLSSAALGELFTRLMCDPAHFPACRVGSAGYVLFFTGFRMANQRANVAAAAAAGGSGGDGAPGLVTGLRGVTVLRPAAAQSAGDAGGAAGGVRAWLSLRGLAQLWAIVEHSTSDIVVKFATQHLVNAYADALPESASLHDVGGDDDDDDNDDEEGGQPAAASGTALGAADDLDDLYGPGPSSTTTTVETTVAAATNPASNPAVGGALAADPLADVDDDAAPAAGATVVPPGAVIDTLASLTNEPPLLVLRRCVREAFVRQCMKRIAGALRVLQAHQAAQRGGSTGDGAPPASAASQQPPPSRDAAVAAARAIARLMRALQALLALVESHDGGAEDTMAGQVTHTHPAPGGGTFGGLHVDVEATHLPPLAGVKPETLMVYVREEVPALLPAATGAGAADSSGAPPPAPPPKVVVHQVGIDVRSHLETIGGLRDRLARALGAPYVRLFSDPPPSRIQAPGAARRALGPPVNGLTLAQARLNTTLWGEVVPLDAVSDDAEARAHAPSGVLVRVREQFVRLARATGRPEPAAAAEFEHIVGILDAAAAAARAPRALISHTPAFFDLLFQLLSCPAPAVVADAWALLQSLPTAASVQRDVATLGGRVPAEEDGDDDDDANEEGRTSRAAPTPLDWPTILDGGSPLRLLYSLEVLDRRLSGALRNDDDDGDGGGGAAAGDDPTSPAPEARAEPVVYADEASSPFVRQFIATGGLEHLLHLLTNGSSPLSLDELLGPRAARQVLYRRCAALLLRLVGLLLRVPHGGLRASVGGGAGSAPLDRPVLVRRLLDVVATIVTADLPRVAAFGGAVSGAAAVAASVATHSPPLLPSPEPSAGSEARQLLEPTSAATSSSLPTSLVPLDGQALAPVAAAASSSSSSSSTGDGGGGGDLGIAAMFGGSGNDDDMFEPVAAPSASDATGASKAGDGKAVGATDGEGDSDAPEAAALRHACELLTSLLLAPSVQLTADTSVPPAPRALHVAAFDAFRGYPSVGQLLAAALVLPKNAAIRRGVGWALVRLTEAADRVAATATGSSSSTAGAVSPVTELVVQSLFAHYACIYLAPPLHSELYADALTMLTRQHSPQRPEGAAAGRARTGSAAAVAVVDSSSGSGASADADARAAALLPQPDAVMASLAASIAAHPVVELGSDEADARDIILATLLTLARLVVALRPAVKPRACAPASNGGLGLIDDVFYACLFAPPSVPAPEGAATAATSGGGDLPKCKSALLRRAAFALLLELAKGCPDKSARLARLLLPHHDPAVAAAAGGAGASGASRGASSSEDDDDARFGQRGRFGGAKGGAAGRRGATTPAAASFTGASGAVVVPPRSSTGYAGLANLGCICYMISVLQQFFMTPSFRARLLLWAEPPSPDAAASAASDSLMYQLQRLFAYLQESGKQFANPRALTRAIKDWDGNPLDVTVQQDVPEFLEKLFADMEAACQGTPLATLPHDVFGGTLVQELLADDPRNVGGGATGGGRLYRARTEEFTHLTLQTKGVGSIEGALDEYFAGEGVEYKWELPPLAAATATASSAVADSGAAAGGGGGAAPSTPGGKPEEATLKSTKRVSLREGGPHLMLQLLRFEYDLDTMMQVKVNNRITFPRTLDLWSYTVHARGGGGGGGGGGEASDAAAASQAPPDRASFVYELTGVVIHLGTAIGGHYYSFIRERHAGTGPAPGDAWFEFNDQFVTPWEATDEAFDRDCFGGTESVPVVRFTAASGTGRLGSAPTTERVKSANAFILFYDRVGGSGAGGAPAPASVPSSPVPLAAAGGGGGGAPFSFPAVPPPPAQAPPSAVVRVSASPGAQPALRLELPANPLAVFLSSLLSSDGNGAGGSGGGARRRRERVRASLRARVPPAILAEITADNLVYWRARTIAGDPVYFDFLRALLAAQQAPLSAPPPYPWRGVRCFADAVSYGGAPVLLARLAVAFLTHTLPASAARGKAPGWCEQIVPLLEGSPTACVAVLQGALGDADALRRALTGGDGASAAADVTAEVTAELVTTALTTVWPLERAGPPLQPQTQLPGSEPAAGGSSPAATAGPWETAPWPAPPGGVAGAVIDALLAALPHVTRADLAKCAPLFFVLQGFAEGGGADARGLLLARGALGRVLCAVLGPECPHYDALRAQASGATAATAGTAGGSSSSSSSSSAATATGKGGKAGRVPRLSGSTETDWRGGGAPGVDALNSPDFAPLLRLIFGLACSASPPSGRPGSPYALPPQAPLSDADADILTSRAFLRSVAAHLTSGTTARSFRGVVSHVLWGAPTPTPPEPAAAGAAAPPSPDPSPAAAAADDAGYDAAVAAELDALPPCGVGHVALQVARVVADAVAEGEYDALPQPFRLAALACAVSGDDDGGGGSVGGDGGTAQGRRVDTLLRAALRAMRGQTRFYLATEAAIEQLTRLAKNPAVAAWLAAHASAWAWCDAWLRAFTVPPPPPPAASARTGQQAAAATGGGGALSLYKSARGGGSSSSYGGFGSGGGGYYRHTLSPRKRSDRLGPNVRALLRRGRRPHFDVYESDDEPQSMVGRRVHWFETDADERGRTGVIAGFHAAAGTHALALEGLPQPVHVDLANPKRALVLLLSDDEGSSSSGGSGSDDEGDAEGEEEVSNSSSTGGGGAAAGGGDAHSLDSGAQGSAAGAPLSSGTSGGGGGGFGGSDLQVTGHAIGTTGGGGWYNYASQQSQQQHQGAVYAPHFAPTSTAIAVPTATAAETAAAALARMSVADEDAGDVPADALAARPPGSLGYVLLAHTAQQHAGAAPPPASFPSSPAQSESALSFEARRDAQARREIARLGGADDGDVDEVGGGGGNLFDDDLLSGGGSLSDGPPSLEGDDDIVGGGRSLPSVE